MKSVVIMIVIFSISLLWGSPEFRPEERVYDFGEILEKDGVVEHTFHFRNTGDEPLKIIDVHAS
ncbi:MAG: DUF1573 domain-containing protein [Candidatus Cloacimonetes bacterium]|nr:DUF1573 domain-containing protein [Candidatus Cloacimonadota bacterium]